MRKWNRLCLISMIVCVMILLASNVFMDTYFHSEYDKSYRVELNRIYHHISNEMNKHMNSFDMNEYLKNFDFNEYKSIIDITYLNADHTSEEAALFYQDNGREYRIYPMMNENRVISYVRIDYKTRNLDKIEKLKWYVNGMIILTTFLLFLGFLYVGSQIIKPFHQISNLPYELSKGHLTKDLKESPNRYFNNFIWSLNLLRENLDDHKKKELELEKEKKLMILSISHDVKTPLSAIKLYARALSTNLYDTQEKKQEIAQKIEEKSNEIEHFISEIVNHTKTDFLHIDVNIQEFYLEDLLKRLNAYYDEKLTLIKTEFIIESYSNCLLKGDIERLLEAIENVIENAIKYGNGKIIRVSFSEEDNYQLITITNWGNTIPEAEVIYMFESFYRGSNAFEKPGSGLGLYISKQILNKMDGEIYADMHGDQMDITFVIQRI